MLPFTPFFGWCCFLPFFFWVVLRFVGAAFFLVWGGRREGRGGSSTTQRRGKRFRSFSFWVVLPFTLFLVWCSTTQRGRREEGKGEGRTTQEEESSTTQKKEEGLPLFLTLLCIKWTEFSFTQWPFVNLLICHSKEEEPKGGGGSSTTQRRKGQTAPPKRGERKHPFSSPPPPPLHSTLSPSAPVAATFSWFTSSSRGRNLNCF